MLMIDAQGRCAIDAYKSLDWARIINGNSTPTNDDIVKFTGMSEGFRRGDYYGKPIVIKGDAGCWLVCQVRQAE